MKKTPKGPKGPKEKKARDLSKLNDRERRLLKGVAEGKTAREAAREAGYAASTVKARLKEIVDKPRMQTAMQEALDKAGLSDDRIAQKIVDGIEAKKCISGVSGGDAGERSMDFVEVDDHQAQFRYTELACKLKGAFPSEKIDYNVNIESHEVWMRRVYERNRDKA